MRTNIFCTGFRIDSQVVVCMTEENGNYEGLQNIYTQRDDDDMIWLVRFHENLVTILCDTPGQFVCCKQVRYARVTHGKFP